MYRNLTMLSIILMISFDVNAQAIKIKNRSFEGAARRGVTNFFLDHWKDCGKIKFRDESPPDVHPNKFWKNNLPSSHGETYVGLVVRPNYTYESITQELSTDIKANTCYAFSIDMAISDQYWSPVANNKNDLTDYNYDIPVVLRVWGSSTACHYSAGGVSAEAEMLAQSIPVSNNDWQSYIFTIEPKKDHKYLTLEAFFNPEEEDSYTGHILLDNASHLLPISCEDDMALVEIFSQEIEDLSVFDPISEPRKVPKTKKLKAKKKPVILAEAPEEEPTKTIIKAEPKILVKEKAKEEKILQELDVNTITEGQIINVEKLFFDADTVSISDDSYEVLDEIYAFLQNNEDVTIEVGGHTNGIPPHAYCDKLSTNRAKTVASYLISKGIPANRIKFKGYGKRNPIASNKSKSGRTKNQRVEIKILSIKQG